MTREELLRALLVEQFGYLTPEYHNHPRQESDARSLRLVWDERKAS